AALAVVAGACGATAPKECQRTVKWVVLEPGAWDRTRTVNTCEDASDPAICLHPDDETLAELKIRATDEVAAGTDTGYATLGVLMGPRGAFAPVRACATWTIEPAGSGATIDPRLGGRLHVPDTDATT